MSRAQLIVTADDVGLDPGMTEGAIRAHREGIVTACSIVANGAAFEDAVARLRDVPSLEVGVHLALVEERSLTGLRMPRKYTTFVPLYLSRVLSIAAIERELRAQIERVLGTGLRVTHLNGHQHLHMLPRVFRVVAQLAGEYGVPYVRIVDDRGVTARSASMSILSALGRLARDGALLARHHERSHDRCRRRRASRGCRSAPRPRRRRDRARDASRGGRARILGLGLRVGARDGGVVRSAPARGALAT